MRPEFVETPNFALPLRFYASCRDACFIKLLIRCVLVVVALLVSHEAKAAQLITNGGFELPVGSHSLTTNLTGWYVSDNVDIVSQSAGGWPAFEGDQSIDLSGCAPDGGYIEQSFSTVPGEEYRLSFQYANNVFEGQTATGTVSVSGASVLIDQFLSHSGSTQNTMNYVPFVTNFVANSSLTTLRFTHHFPPSSQCQGLALDAVEVTDSAPYIKTPPRSQVGFWGKSVTFSVMAYGWSPLNYQWRKDGVPILMATNSSLLLANLQSTNAGNYSVVVTNVYGSVTSNPAILTINPAGVSLAMFAGVEIDGVPGLTYGIQYSTNVDDTNGWRGITNVTLIGANALWIDEQTPIMPRRFYRVIPGPISVP